MNENAWSDGFKHREFREKVQAESAGALMPSEEKYKYERRGEKSLRTESDVSEIEQYCVFA
jgi:hypothetical protein